MSGKGAKGLIMGKNSAPNKDKDKKKPISRSSRAGLQVYIYIYPLFANGFRFFAFKTCWVFFDERLVLI